MQTDLQIPARILNLELNSEKKDHRVKIKDIEKMNNYMDLARGLKNLKLRVISIVIAAFGTVFQKVWKREREREREIIGRIEITFRVK